MLSECKENEDFAIAANSKDEYFSKDDKPFDCRSLETERTVSDYN